MERSLARVVRVDEVAPILDADKIETVKIGGWQVVVGKGQFLVGSPVVYFEVDSMLPLKDARFSFLEARGRKMVDGKDYHVLRTAKLRGTLSQGLVLPLDDFPELEGKDGDVTGVLGIEKYEPPIPAELASKILGAFPTHLFPKTDAERVQNLASAWDEVQQSSWYATEKIDGTSITLFNLGDGLRLCSRNYEIVPDDNITIMQVLQREGISIGEGYAVQGELYGEGIQGNPLKVKGHHFAIFNVFRKANGRFELLARNVWPASFLGNAVPLLEVSLPATIQETIDQAEGIMSKVSPTCRAEGIVWHTVFGIPLQLLNGRGNFKAINNTYLLKQKD